MILNFLLGYMEERKLTYQQRLISNVFSVVAVVNIVGVVGIVNAVGVTHVVVVVGVVNVGLHEAMIPAKLRSSVEMLPPSPAKNLGRKNRSSRFTVGVERA